LPSKLIRTQLVNKLKEILQQSSQTTKQWRLRGNAVKMR